jgi:hypothetical protein
MPHRIRTNAHGVGREVSILPDGPVDWPEGCRLTVEPVNAGTQEGYVLSDQEQCEPERSLLEQKSQHELSSAIDEIPPGILRSQQAFWRELPELLKAKKNRGQWVCYHGDERVGISADDVPLIRECLRRGIPDDSYYVAMIRARNIAPWEIEEVEPLGSWHFEDTPPPS